MTQKYITILEFPSFTKEAKKVFNQLEHMELLNYLSTYPEIGKVIPGTAGLRKLRWAVGTKGKRGGARVIYYYHASELNVLLLAVYTKGKQEDLSSLDKKILKKLIEEYLK